MGVFFKQVLADPDDGKTVSCATCGTQLALCRDLLSTNFRGRTTKRRKTSKTILFVQCFLNYFYYNLVLGTGGAMLFDRVVNVTTGPPEESVMTTGMHTIRVLHCLDCGENVGWK